MLINYAGPWDKESYILFMVVIRGLSNWDTGPFELATTLQQLNAAVISAIGCISHKIVTNAVYLYAHH